ncbi:MAG: SDR family NAD(P)-dependent oxidoreductase [Solirubrobacterales bacterium]|nr:SDR family NAD(P)-dependent oxidoreductase [Solirubrobacterales bacterium]
MALDLTGTTIVIIGATGVLGSCLAQQLADAGVHVAAIVRDSASLDPAVASAHAVADITDHAALRSAFATLGPIDGVINAAGAVAFGTLAELDDETLTELFAINAIGPMVALRESAPHIKEGGFFVNISGVVALQPMAGLAAYSASKAAAWSAMTSVARELRRQQIDVIDARPPHTETGLATRPLAGTAPKLPVGLDPSVVAARIIAGIVDGERDLPVEAFQA